MLSKHHVAESIPNKKLLIIVSDLPLAALPLPEINIKLWLDDIRDPAQFGYIGWTWVKSADEAIALLASGRVSKASLDHDLTVRQTIGYADGEKTGYDVVRWMDEHGVWPPEGVQVHSANPTGRLRMEQVVRKRFGDERPCQAAPQGQNG